MSERLLGIGECMVELFPEGPGLWRQGFAGDVFNALWYARAYVGADARVGFHTGLGRDALSGQLEAFLDEHGIDLGDSPRFDDRTLGLYAIHLDGGERSFSYWRDASAARRLAADPGRLARRVAGAELVYVSGITLAILAPPDLDALCEVLAAARGERTVAFDPNVRPRLWADPARMRPSIERVAALADVVLPGVEDETFLAGPGTAEEVARRYAGFGAGLVVVKDGARDVLARGVAPALGGRAAEPVDVALATTPIDAPLDTTGAGDAFAGAFLAGLLAGQGVAGAIGQAQRCAATVVMTRGALCPHADLPGVPGA